jgi:hypothetical protein
LGLLKVVTLFSGRSCPNSSLGTPRVVAGRQRSFLLLTLAFLALPCHGAVPAQQEDWKGTSAKPTFALGGITGLAIVDGYAGYALLGSAAVEILNKGFVSDLNNDVMLETEVGPIWVNGLTDVFVGAHLRWNFHKNEDWTFYGLGGVAALFGTGAFNNHNEVNPRFGIGALWEPWPRVALRAELSHELIALGVCVSL